MPVDYLLLSLTEAERYTLDHTCQLLPSLVEVEVYTLDHTGGLLPSRRNGGSW